MFENKFNFYLKNNCIKKTVLNSNDQYEAVYQQIYDSSLIRVYEKIIENIFCFAKYFYKARAVIS